MAFVSPSSQRAWIEIVWSIGGFFIFGSPSSQRAWIEICSRRTARSHGQVALLAEGVDRNFLTPSLYHKTNTVALLAEGVDRNQIRRRTADGNHLVALLAEGVDRNNLSQNERIVVELVALLAEGVDRNHSQGKGRPESSGSPSSQRAWIEIC